MKKLFLTGLIMIPFFAFSAPNIYIDNLLEYSKYRTAHDNEKQWTQWNGCTLTNSGNDYFTTCSGHYPEAEGSGYDRSTKFHFRKHSSGLFQIISQECTWGNSWPCEDFNN